MPYCWQPICMDLERKGYLRRENASGYAATYYLRPKGWKFLEYGKKYGGRKYKVLPVEEEQH